MVIVVGYGHGDIILPPAMGKIVGQTRFFSLGEATSLGEGNSEFKPVKLNLKIDLVSYPARAEGSVNMDTSLLNTQQYKVNIKGKVEQSGERSSALSYTSV